MKNRNIVDRTIMIAEEHPELTEEQLFEIEDAGFGTTDDMANFNVAYIRKNQKLFVFDEKAWVKVHQSIFKMIQNSHTLDEAAEISQLGMLMCDEVEEVNEK